MLKYIIQHYVTNFLLQLLINKSKRMAKKQLALHKTNRLEYCKAMVEKNRREKIAYTEFGLDLEAKQAEKRLQLWQRAARKEQNK